MKAFLIVFFSLGLMACFTIFVFDKDKNVPQQSDGIELPEKVSDSLTERGRYLIEKTGYREDDLNAISTYLNSLRAL